MVNDEVLDKLASQVSAIMTEISDETVNVIASRLNDLSDLTATDAHTLARLSEQKDLTEITDIITQKTKLATAEVEAMYKALATANDTWASAYYAATETPFSGWQSSQIQSALVSNAAKSQASNILSLSNSTAFLIDGRSMSIAEAYNDAVNKAITAVSTGVTDSRTAINKAIKQLSDSGLRAVSYASGRAVRVDSAVRMNVMDGFRATMMELREQQGKEFGADGVEVSAHGLCAPDHQHIQGKQYSDAEWSKVNGSLDRQIGHANCRHITFPIIVGISTPAHTKEELKAYRDASNEEVYWNGLSGKQMSNTRYEATQYQRQLETAIRHNKSMASCLKAGGDETAARRYTTQAKALTAQYKAISEQMGISAKAWRTASQAAPVTVSKIKKQAAKAITKPIVE